MKRAKKQGQRRMMYASLSGSEKYHELPPTPPSSQLLYCLIYPHTDDFGHLSASASNIKRVVVPGFEWTLAEIDTLLSDLWDVGLIEFYEVSGKRYLQIVGFEDTQIFNHERVALCPAPIDFLQRLESSKTSLLERKGKLSKVKVSEVNNPPAGGPPQPTDKMTEYGQEFYNFLTETEKVLSKHLGYKFINSGAANETKTKIVRGLVVLNQKWPEAVKFTAMHVHRGGNPLWILGAINACNARDKPPEKWREYYQACIHKHGEAIGEKEWQQEQQDIKAGFKKIRLSDLLPSAGGSYAEDQ